MSSIFLFSQKNLLFPLALPVGKDSRWRCSVYHGKLQKKYPMLRLLQKYQKVIASEAKQSDKLLYIKRLLRHFVPRHAMTTSWQ